jgi:hypothetical protein
LEYKTTELDKRPIGIKRSKAHGWRNCLVKRVIAKNPRRYTTKKIIKDSPCSCPQNKKSYKTASIAANAIYPIRSKRVLSTGGVVVVI